MAHKDRKASDDLICQLRELEQRPHAFGFYYALRLMEALNPAGPRLGRSKRPEDDPIRLAQQAAMTFESSSLTAFTPGSEDKPHRLDVRLLGLLGPNGPLPLHLTEYVLARRRDHRDRTLGEFLNIFHHRILSLFYRAWANNEPTVNYDRPEEDPFGGYLGSFLGLGKTPLKNRNDIPLHTKYYYCGLLAGQTKSAAGLQAMIADYFNVPTYIEEFIGEWLDLPKQNICRLGLDESNGTLGQSVIIGSKIWSCQHKFRIHLGPLTYQEYERFLPTGNRIVRLVQLVRNYIGDEFAWDARLILKKDEVPKADFKGNCRLGWTSWSGPRKSDTHADDLVLDAFQWVIGSQGA